MRLLDLGVSLPVFLLAAATTASAQSCYYPDGAIADDFDYEPCNGNGTSFDQCCVFKNERCLENGMCAYKADDKEYDYRPPCANKDWDNCVDPCSDIKNTSWVEVKLCSFDQKYCCNPERENGNCCTDSSFERFDLDAPSTSSSTTSSSSSTSETSGPTSEAPSSGNEQDNNNNDDEPALSGGEIGAIAGSLGAAALIGLGVLTWCLLKKRKAKQTGSTSNPAELQAADGSDGIVSENKSPGGKYYYAGHHGSGHDGNPPPPPSEMMGSSVAVESDSREVQNPRQVYEMSA